MPFPLRHFGACCIAGWLHMPAALAEDPASHQLRDQQQVLRQLEHQQRLQRWQRTPSAGSDDGPASTRSDAGPCLTTRGVRLSGNQRLSTQSLEQIGRAHV